MSIETTLQIIGLLSLLSFAVSLVCVPWLLNRLPKDFFTGKARQQRMRRRREQHPLMMVIIWIIRHCAGLILFAAGLTMLFMPGQGILTILLALSLMDFPGRYKFITLIVQQQDVRRALDWVRRKGGMELFTLDDEHLH